MILERNSGNLFSIIMNLLKVYGYCKTFNIRGITFSPFKENDVLAHVNFCGLDVPWPQLIMNI